MANKTIHGIVRLDKMSGTIDGTMLKSVKFETEIDNGNIVKLGGLLEGEREIYEATVPTAGTAIKELALIAAPEVIADESRRYGLEDYVNPAKTATRAYRFHSGDIFSVTKECLTVADIEAVAKGWVAVVGDSTKLTLQASGSDALGTVIDIETVGNNTFYVIEVNL